MSARAERTLLRVGTLLAALIVCTVIVVLFPNLDPRFIGAVYTAGITAALGLDQFLKNSGDNAAPTVAGVNAALQTNAVTVPPPKVAVPEAEVLVTPAKPFDTLPPQP